MILHDYDVFDIIVKSRTRDKEIYDTTQVFTFNQWSKAFLSQRPRDSREVYTKAGMNYRDIISSPLCPMEFIFPLYLRVNKQEPAGNTLVSGAVRDGPVDIQLLNSGGGVYGSPKR